jgi:VanZ family protein
MITTRYTKPIYITILSITLCLNYCSVSGQTDSLRLKKTILTSASIAALIGLNTALYYAWYNNYNTGKFHTFNDNHEWQGADKCGHAFTTFNIGKSFVTLSNSAGWQSSSQRIIAGSVGLLFMTSIEIQDGFSRGWGFSWGDMGANTLGTTLAITQAIAFKNAYPIQLKYFYTPSSIAQYNPKLLGNTGTERLLKDYNAQSYWLSIFPKQAFKRSKLPAWLGVSLGYKATGMLGAEDNTKFTNVYYERTRRYYLSVDIDVSQLKTKHNWLHKTLQCVSFIKFPLPVISVDNKGVWHGQLLPWAQ